MDVGRVEDFELVRLLGEGGMALVYEAFNLSLNRLEAVKFLKPHLAADPNIVDRFLKEAKNSANLHHKNIVGVYGFGYSSVGIPYIRMELLKGISLDEHMAKGGPLGLDDTVKLLEPVADALDYAHNQGVIHRDIKPSNIFLAHDHSGLAPKVLDFGISVAVDGSPTDRNTKAGMIVGTPSYMAPEQVDFSMERTRAIDQYSLAIVAYEALFGRPPISESDGLSSIQVLAAKCTKQIEFTQVSGGLDSSRFGPLRKALSINPGDRYDSCSEFLRALKSREQTAEVTTVRSESQEVKVDKKDEKVIHPRSSFHLAAVLALVVLCAAVLGALVLSQLQGKADGSQKQEIPRQDKVASRIVPKLIGLTKSEAFDRLAWLDVKTNSKSEFHPSVPMGEILRQDPKADQSVEPGATVTIVVSKGPEPLLPIEASDLRAVLGKWEGAIRSEDLDSFAALYHPEFRGKSLSIGGQEGNYNKAKWISTRSPMIRRLEKFNISEIKPYPGTGVAKVSFWQEFGMNTYGDQGRKVITVKRLQGQLKIIREEMLDASPLEDFPTGLEEEEYEGDGYDSGGQTVSNGDWSLYIPSGFELTEQPSDSNVSARVYKNGNQLIRVQISKQRNRTVEMEFYDSERNLSSKKNGYMRISAVNTRRGYGSAIQWEYERTTTENYRQRNKAVFLESGGVVYFVRVAAPVAMWYQVEEEFNQVLNSFSIQ